MKKIDKLVLNSFIGPFILTFLVVVFILLNIQMLKYFDDIIGKGLGWDVIGKLLFYFAIFTTPTAMPLAVLLSSLITFGNLGEHFELTAIKSAGISLIRTLRPIFFFVLGLTAFAFYVNNNLVPKAALEAYSLLYDIKQKKPALELREGAFYMGIPDISIKINKKFPDDDAALKGVVIYDHRKNEGNKEVTVADSGRMYTVLNERYLKLELYSGYNYTEGASNDEFNNSRAKPTGISLSRSKFAKTQFVFDLSSFQMQTTDKKWFQGNRIMRNLSELNSDIDSLSKEITSLHVNYYAARPSYFTYYRKDESFVMPPELLKFRAQQDSLTATKFSAKYNTETNVVAETQPTIANQDSLNAKQESIRKRAVVSKKVEKRKPKQLAGIKSNRLKSNKWRGKKKPPIQINKTNGLVVKSPPVAKIKITDSLIAYRIDSIITMKPDADNIQKAANEVRRVKGLLSNSNTAIDNYQKEQRIYATQWHRIIANSLACIAMFLIGAPLGAIIKKGGLGVPFLISIIFFIIFYIMNMLGEKWAKQGTVNVVTGVWAADFILLAIGLVFLRQARVDARLFDADFYLVVIDKFKRWLKNRKATQSA